MNGEVKTLISLALVSVVLFAWMDFRHVSHSEISNTRCSTLNDKWSRTYRRTLNFADGLDVTQFDCPSTISGIALGLEFLSETQFYATDGRPKVEFWEMLRDVNPVLGDRAGIRFTGRATYSKNRIDLGQAVLQRGDPAEIAGVLVHELRHLQEERNTHVPCRNEALATCDLRLEEDLLNGGAYNYTVLFYDRVLRASNASAQAKRSASRLLQGTLDNRFNAIRPELRNRYEP